MVRGAQQAIVHGVAKSQARLRDWAAHLSVHWSGSWQDTTQGLKRVQGGREMEAEHHHCIIVEESLVSRNNHTVFRGNTFFLQRKP